MPSVRAFDTSIGTNFTNDACPDFFSNFTSNSTFNDCHPMSFYLQNSQSFVKQVRKGLNETEAVVKSSCSVDFDKCTNIMHELDQQLLKHCQQDYKQENPLVVQAHVDFMSYGVIHEATCVKNHPSNHTSPSQRAEYCYTDALFGPNSANDLDAYLYSLPLGQAYPGTKNNNGTWKTENNTIMKTTCSKCTVKVMNIYHNYTSNSELPITSTYKDAAEVINKGCNSKIVNETISSSAKRPKQADENSAQRQSPSIAALPTTLVMIVMINILLSVLG